MHLFPPTDNTLLYFLRHTLDIVQVTFSLGITPGAATQVQQPLHFLRGGEKLTCTNPSTESAPQCCPPTEVPSALPAPVHPAQLWPQRESQGEFRRLPHTFTSPF